MITHWPDMLKVAGSLVTNQVRAYDLLRMFGREGRPTPLGAAFAEYGRIAKTEHLLRVVDPVDDTYRRQMNRQLTVQESRHKLARDVCHGKRGTIHQAYRDGMEDQLGALGLVLNAIVLWTTRYIGAAVAQLQDGGHEIRDEDIARLSPLKHRNLNLLGRYSSPPPRRLPAPCVRCGTLTRLHLTMTTTQKSEPAQTVVEGVGYDRMRRVGPLSRVMLPSIRPRRGCVQFDTERGFMPRLKCFEMEIR
ncbi:hypothetical protein FHS32_001988 [Streptomyces albaduncus]|uniref:Tn3 transposase DDE domain-containing protein n=1 Tax=Streptomyces griseoloalbus TaxID=67303 RepID=A0A7W8BKY3_9ACTN|nr:hypothetical protein [Streptomyces albaduncus]